MAAAGFAVGLGNIWRFSYLVGKNGGGAFLFIYLILTVLIGIPLYTAEVSLGRKVQSSPIAGMRKLNKKGSPWNLIGWFGVIATTLILSYYYMIIGWVLAYFFKISSGEFVGASTETLKSSFDTFSANSPVIIGLYLVVCITVTLIVTKGIQKGVEKVCKVVMPVLFVSLVLLAIRSVTFPGAMEGVIWYLKPDFSAVTAQTILAALGQAFFSIGIGMATAFVYGSYLKPKKSDVPGNSLMVIGFDTMIAVLAGFVIFPALFAFGLEPDVGAGLLFITMAKLFSVIPGGQFIGGAFFLLVVFAGITSAIGHHEGIASSIMDLFNLERKKSVWIATGIVFCLGVPSVLSLGPWSNIMLFGKPIFDFVDFLSGSVLLTLDALLIILYTGYVWKFSKFKEETNIGSEGLVKVQNWWSPVIKFIAPIAVTIILLTGVGII